MTITERLAIYTLSQCPECGNQRESVYAGPGLVCRRHQGHPLFEAEIAGKEDTRTRQPSQPEST